MIFKAKLDLGQNLKNEYGADECPRVSTSCEIAQAFETIAERRQEIMIAGAIDCKCRLIHWSVIAIGSNDRMTVRVGDAFLGAIQSGASGIFLIHNHPSGSLVPSKEDFEFTNSVAEAGIIVGYPLLDHVIVSKAGHRSLMNQLTLRSRRNPAPLTTGYVCDAPAQSDVTIRWKCSRCRNQNFGNWTNGVQSHDSEISLPVKCGHCSALTWLKACHSRKSM